MMGFVRNIILSPGRHVIPIILLVYGIIFLLSKSPNSPYDRLIINDGKAYYAYLPAIFIYRDLSYNFVEYYESKYYPSDSDPSYFKEFRFQYQGRTVNKAFAGIAVLMLPFFLLAHLLALLFGQPDGYSMIYQFAIGFSAYFYLWLGLILLRKLLRKFSENENFISLIIFAIAIGTNIVYYTVSEGTMPHVYLFFLINLFLYISYRAIHEPREAWFINAGIVFGLILISRPQNGFIILALPFLAGSWHATKSAIRALFQRSVIFKTSLAVLAVIPLQLTLWYAQTGYLVVYSYGNEKFDFLNPQIVNLLWSYEKGWMIYTPLSFLALAGLIRLAVKNLFRASFILITFAVISYIASCWWVWHYTSQFGQRVFIDFYGLLAILLLFGFDLFKNRNYRIGYKLIILVLIALNLFQYYQHRVWVYPKGPVTKQVYWSNFFRIHPQTSVTVPENIIERINTFVFPLAGENIFLDEKNLLQTYDLDPYQYNKLLTVGYGQLAILESQILKLKTSVWGCAKKELNLYAGFYSGGKKYSDHSWRIDPNLRCGQLNEVEVAVYLPISFTNSDSACLFIFSPEYLSVGIGSSEVQIISLKQGHEARWISRPLNSVESFQSRCFDLEENDEQLKPGQLSTDFSISGSHSVKIDSLQAFGAAFTGSVEQYFTGVNRALQVSFATYSLHEINHAVLVIALAKANQTLNYEELPLTLTNSGALWVNHHIRHPLPFMDSALELKVYFWDKSASKPWYIDDVCYDFITLTDRSFPGVKNESAAFANRVIMSRNDTAQLNNTNQFHGLPFIALSDLSGCEQAEVVLSASIMADVWFPGISLVLSHYQGNEMISYNGRYLAGQVLKNRWRDMQWEFQVDPCYGANDTLRIYFWNPSSGERIWIRDFTLFVPQPGEEITIKQK